MDNFIVTPDMEAAMAAVCEFGNRTDPYAPSATLEDWLSVCPYDRPFILCARSAKNGNYEYNVTIKEACVILTIQVWDEYDIRAISSCKIPHSEFIEKLNSCDDPEKMMKWMDSKVKIE